uniref:Wall-associated receptor kinase galacturonan-binding domain-containing protein n=1 Tax=Quercus lobata TaxID=97700 RepID=A0A7N2RAF1_QUELO
MVRGLGFTAGLTVLIALVLLVPPSCSTTLDNHTCAHFSSCGNIPNISFPFRLKTDPKKCGHSRYELSCENNRTVLYLLEGKYYVQEISYSNYTIRIVDSSIHKYNYFSTPSYSLYGYSFRLHYSYAHATYQLRMELESMEWNNAQLSRSLALMSCEKPVNSPLYLDTSTCNYNDNSSSISDSKRRYRYVTVGRTNASQVGDSCQVEKMFLTSWPINNDDPNISCKDVHNELAYGFELSWLDGICRSYCREEGQYCYPDGANHVQCIYLNSNEGLLDQIRYTVLQGEVSFSNSCLKAFWFSIFDNAAWWNKIKRNSHYLLTATDGGITMYLGNRLISDK